MKCQHIMRPTVVLFVTALLTPRAMAGEPLAPTPPMGWNSYDAYAIYAHEQACYDNLKTFVETFKPLGYEYFVIDGGWFNEYDFVPGTMFPTSRYGHTTNIDEYGYYIPSECYFPNGLQGIAEECHKNGAKFGIHILRGIPRKAYEENTPVKGTRYFARDIADTDNVCPWNPLNYGVDMSKPGAQAYYDGWIQLLADWGADFIKADDIVTHPEEIVAVQKAIRKCGRPIVLSLSPGSRVLGDQINRYAGADMLRVTNDVWDTQDDIDICFDAWLTWQYVPVREGFWFDMDLIPFGELQVMVPEGTTGRRVISGTHRFDRLTVPQKETFITMRAMSASPLMIGGVLPTLDKESLRLLTNKQMIACNQNGVMGHLTYNIRGVQVWLVEEKRTAGKKGWLGVFNRKAEPKAFAFSWAFASDRLGLDPRKKYDLDDVWNDRPLEPGRIELEPNGCVFIRYEERPGARERTP